MATSTSSNPSQPLIAGQAVYTWSSQTEAGVGGDDFVAISPGLHGKTSWLKNLPATIIQFAAGNVLTPDERSRYKPVGRHVDGSEAVLFRKVDAGKDAHERPGRYIVHLVVGQREYLPLSSLYTIYHRNWLSAADVPLNHHLDLHDLSIPGPSNHQILNLTPSGEERVIRSVKQLVASGTTDVTGFDDKEMLSILACFPTWVDANAVLMPVWSDLGPKVTLSVLGGAPPVKAPDYRAHVHVPRIRDLRAQYSGLLEVGGHSHGAHSAKKIQHSSQNKRRKVRWPARNGELGREAATVTQVVEGNSGTSAHAMDELKSVVEKWQRRGHRKLSVNEKQIIENAAADALGIVSRSDGRLPDRLSRGQLDALAVTVLRECGGARYWPLVVACLPEATEIVSRYVTNVAEPSLLLAAFYINLTETRRFEIVLNGSFPEGAMAGVVATVRENRDLTDGLCESLRISCYRQNRLLWALLHADEPDQGWLFSEVLPRALDRADLVPMAAGYPEQLVRWFGIANEEYARGLTEMLHGYSKYYDRRHHRIRGIGSF